jgi:DNA-binding XRE family transcriptional regulator
MNAARRSRLEAAGWKIGGTGQFLGLSREETELVEMKLALSESLKRHRQRRKLTQAALAVRLGSSQSRVAKLEAGARGVSLDLLFRALFATGVTTADIAREIRPRRRSAA